MASWRWNPTFWPPTPDYQIATICISFFLRIWYLFSGSLIPRTQIPLWWRWYYWASPVAWTLYGLITSQVGNKNAELEIPGAENMGLIDFLKQSLGYDYYFLPAIAAAHIAWVLLFVSSSSTFEEDDSLPCLPVIIGRSTTYITPKLVDKDYE